MLKFQRFILNQFLLLDTPPKEGDSTPPPSTTPPPSNEPDKDKIIAELTSRIEKLEGTKPPTQTPPKEDDDLAKKAEAERLEREKLKSQTNVMASAIKYNMTASKWLEDNEKLLPDTVKGIFEAAEKENYDTDVDKANAIKVGVVSEFFAVQDNMDKLTDAQKIELEQFKKLTKTDKEQRVGKLYDQIFEPTFNHIKALERAKSVAKGDVQQTDKQAAYVKKMQEKSLSKYLGGKKDA